MSSTLQSFLSDSITLREQILATPALLAAIEQCGRKIKEVVAQGGTVYSCGNGGSACDVMHLTEELTTRYKRDRPGIRAQHFLDASALTCWGNDKEFNDSFARQVRTFCTSKDIFIALSTSGKSPNVVEALKAAKNQGTFTIGLTGRGGGLFPSLCDIAVVVPHDATDRIQEVHITLIHYFCEVLET